MKYEYLNDSNERMEYMRKALEDGSGKIIWRRTPSKFMKELSVEKYYKPTQSQISIIIDEKIEEENE